LEFRRVLFRSERDTIEVGTPICMMETEGGTGESAVESVEEPPRIPDESPPESIASEKANAQKGARISPVVMRLANENSINLDDVTGTGFEGRITKKDILKAIEAGPS